MRPLAPSFAGFDRRWIRSDVVAGLTVWAVLVPESLAYATIAGVPPVVGLYAAVPALALYALLGSSRHLVVSPMSATAALSLSVVAAVATDPTDPAQVLALTTALALATGLVALVAGGLRLGFLAAFISEPVLKGFIIGLALTIMIGQLPALFGVEKGSGNFFEKAWDLIQNLGDAELLATTVGIGSLLLLLGLRRWLPIVPGSLVVALGSIALVTVLNLEDDGLAIVGHIDSGLPSLGLPDVSGDAFVDLLGASVGRHAGGLRRGPRRREDVRRQGGLRHRRQQGAARAGRRQRRLRAGQRHGGQRQSLQDRRQRLCRREVAALPADRRRPHPRHPALPDRHLREAAGGDAGRHRGRRRRRARRHRVAAPAVAGADRPAGPDLPGDQPSGLRRRDHRDARGARSSTPSPAWSSGSASRCSCCSPAPPARTWPCSRRSRRPVPGSTPVRRGSTPSATPTSSRWPACSSYASRRRWSSATRSTCGTGSARSSAR